MLIDKYNRLLLDKLPTEITTELEQIKTDTDNFSDEELIDIYRDNFNDLFEIIKTKYPEALKAKKKLVVKTKGKLVKKAEPKRKLVKKKNNDIDCKEAVEIINTQQKKKAKAAKARAEAPKKKVSTAAREKQVKALASLFKTKDFKGNPLAASNFAKKIVSVYKNNAEISKTFADQLEADINTLLDGKVEKMAKGGKVNGGLRSIKVTYSDGTIIETNMAEHLTDKEMLDYFKVGKSVNIGAGGKDKMATITKSEIIMAKGGQVEGDVKDEINKLYKKSGFISDDFTWEGKLLEMIQDNSIEAYQIYQSLNKAQKEAVLQYQFYFDSDMGSEGNGEIETSKENLEIMLQDAKNGKTYNN